MPNSCRTHLLCFSPPSTGWGVEAAPLLMIDDQGRGPPSEAAGGDHGWGWAAQPVSGGVGAAVELRGAPRMWVAALRWWQAIPHVGGGFQSVGAESTSWEGRREYPLCRPTAR